MEPEDEVAQTETEQTEQVATEETTTEEVEVDWKAEAEKNKAEAEKHKTAFEDQKKRAEKAEAKLKEKPEAPAKSATQTDKSLSSTDVLALSGASITEVEDVEYLQSAAAIQGLTVAQALKDNTIMTLLKEKQEQRHTAIATTTGGTRRVPSERKGSDLLSAATAANLPNPKDVRKLVRASLGVQD